MDQKRILFLLVFLVLGGGLFFMGCDNNSGVADSSGPPEVTSVNPEDNADNVSVSTTVRATFNQPMDESTINESTFTLREDTVNISGSITTTDTTAILSLSDDLEFNTTYTARISSDVKDAKDKSLPSDYQWNFTTEEAPDDDDDEDTNPFRLNSLTPNGTEDVSVETNITATFSENLNSSTVDTESFNLQQNNTEVEGTVNVSDNRATFNPSENLEYNSSYSITLTTAIEDEAGNNLAEEIDGSFTTEEQPQDDGDNDNGENSDTDPPTVDDVEPDNGASDIDTDVAVTVEFSEEMDESTINGNTLILQESGTRVVGSVTYSDGIATFTPDGNLDYNTEYTLTITTGAEDTAGNGLTDIYISSFTTEEEPDTEPPSVISSNPENGDSGVSVNTNITVEFTEPMDESTLNNSVTLQGPSGQVGGSIEVSADDATFTPDGELENEASYTFEVSTQAADLAGNTLQNPYSITFTTETPEDNVPPEVNSLNPNGANNVSVETTITANFSEPLNSETINTESFILQQNGTTVEGTVSYTDNSAVFEPNENLSYNSTYSVTLTTNIEDEAGNNLQENFEGSFSTEEQEQTDTDPPTVGEVNPENGANDVSTDVTISVEFSEEMNESTLNNNTLILQGDGTNVSGDISHSDGIATYTPDVSLDYSTDYTLTITTGAEDIAGNGLAENFNTSFTTEAESDTDPPSVTNSSPENGDTGIPVNTEVTAQFNEPMDETTLNPNSVSLEGPSGDVNATINTSSQSVTLTPNDSLQNATEYTFEISPEAADLSGNTLQDVFAASFVTEEGTNDDDDEGPPGDGDGDDNNGSGDNGNGNGNGNN